MFVIPNSDRRFERDRRSERLTSQRFSHELTEHGLRPRPSTRTSRQAGRTARFALTVVDAACAPLAGALVELWHADALGEYSGYAGDNGHHEPDDRTFLRGGVLTDSGGLARVTTVYPGWYRGRCAHVHVKVHTGVTVTADGHFTGGSTVHTGRLFLDGTVTAFSGPGRPPGAAWSGR